MGTAVVIEFIAYLWDFLILFICLLRARDVRGRFLYLQLEALLNDANQWYVLVEDIVVKHLYVVGRILDQLVLLSDYGWLQSIISRLGLACIVFFFIFVFEQDFVDEFDFLSYFLLDLQDIEPHAISHVNI